MKIVFLVLARRPEEWKAVADTVTAKVESPRGRTHAEQVKRYKAACQIIAADKIDELHLPKGVDRFRLLTLAKEVVHGRTYLEAKCGERLPSVGAARNIRLQHPDSLPV